MGQSRAFAQDRTATHELALHSPERLRRGFSKTPVRIATRIICGT